MKICNRINNVNTTMSFCVNDNNNITNIDNAIVAINDQYQILFQKQIHYLY